MANAPRPQKRRLAPQRPPLPLLRHARLVPLLARLKPPISLPTGPHLPPRRRHKVRITAGRVTKLASSGVPIGAIRVGHTPIPPPAARPGAGPQTTTDTVGPAMAARANVGAATKSRARTTTPTIPAKRPAHADIGPVASAKEPKPPISADTFPSALVLRDGPPAGRGPAIATVDAATVISARP